MAVAVVGVVLGLAVGTSLLPTDVQRIVFRTPLLITILDRRHRGRADPPRPPAPGPMSAVLAARRRDLETLASERWDLLVVGGGITGSGIALDAASRGLRAALIERDDFAVGTSGRSSRLIHGGLRYLEQFRIGLVREALAERGGSCPVRAAPRPDRAVRLPALRWAADPSVLRRRAHPVRPARRGVRRRLAPSPLGRRGARGDPGPPRDRLRGAFVYHDGQEDDARYTLAVARTARIEGALPVTRVSATGPTRALRPDRRRDSPGRARRRQLRDRSRAGDRRHRGVVGSGRWTVPGRRLRPGGPAEPWDPPRRAARPDPERPWPHAAHPGPGLLPRPVARSLGDRDDRPRR